MTELGLDAQIDAYESAGYPALAGLSEAEFATLFEPLRTAAEALHATADAGNGHIGFVAVVSDAVISPERRVPLLRLPGSVREGVLDRNHGPDGLEPYVAVEDSGIPQELVYLLVEVDRGDEFRNVAPRYARPAIGGRSRSPLTIAEGLSIATVFPEFLMKNHCFMLAGSSRGDKRVPALWISGRAPKLGWCFDGVPHSWLGVASAAGRFPDGL